MGSATFKRKQRKPKKALNPIPGTPRIERVGAGGGESGEHATTVTVDRSGRQRQESILELINTEQDYLYDIELTVDVSILILLYFYLFY